eukprot:2867129-Prymnesium_polylepis.1
MEPLHVQACGAALLRRQPLGEPFDGGVYRRGLFICGGSAERIRQHFHAMCRPAVVCASDAIDNGSTFVADGEDAHALGQRHAEKHAPLHGPSHSRSDLTGRQLQKLLRRHLGARRCPIDNIGACRPAGDFHDETPAPRATMLPGPLQQCQVAVPSAAPAHLDIPRVAFGPKLLQLRQVACAGCERTLRAVGRRRGHARLAMVLCRHEED